MSIKAAMKQSDYVHRIARRSRTMVSVLQDLKAEGFVLEELRYWHFDRLRVEQFRNSYDWNNCEMFYSFLSPDLWLVESGHEQPELTKDPEINCDLSLSWWLIADLWCCLNNAVHHKVLLLVWCSWDFFFFFYTKLWLPVLKSASTLLLDNTP